MKFLQNCPDRTRLARCYYLLGEVLRRFDKNFNGAIKHYQLSEKFSRNLKDIERMMRSYHGLAATYLDRAHAGDQVNAYPQALRYFEQSLALASRLKKDLNSLDTETAAIYLCIGMVHQEQGKLQKAKDIYQNVIQVLESDTPKTHLIYTRLCEAYLALADTLVTEHQWRAGNVYLDKADKIIKKRKGLNELMFGSQLLRARIFAGLKKSKKMQKHLALCIATKNRLKKSSPPH